MIAAPATMDTLELPATLYVLAEVLISTLPLFVMVEGHARAKMFVLATVHSQVPIAPPPFLVMVTWQMTARYVRPMARA